MKLRLSDEENKAGIKLSNQEDGAAETNDMPQRAVAGAEDNPWDYDKFKDLEDPGAFYSIHKPIRIDVPPDHEYSIFPNVSKIFMYIAVLLLIGVFVLMCAGKPVDILFRIQKYKVLFAIGNGILFLDALIVNFLYERKISLLILAWLFPFAYPLARNHHVDDRPGMGGICCFAIIAAFIATGANVYHTYAQYGEYCMNENEILRHGVAEIMAQESANGVSLGTVLKRNYKIENVQVNESGTVIQFEGYGKWYISKMGYEPTAGFDIPTVLVYKQQSAGGYKLTEAVLDGTSVSGEDIYTYENKIL